MNDGKNYLKKVLAMIVIGLCAVASHAADAGRTFLAPPGADPKVAPPLSSGVMVGSTFYVADHLCTDLDLFDKFNVIYRSYFHDNYPARAFIGVSKLVRGAHFEIAGVAVKPAGHR